MALIVIPAKLGGFTAIFAKVPSTKLILGPSLFAGYSTLALGSALALFLYPHAITGTFASKSQQTIKRNMAFLPAYSFLLGLIALMGYMAIAAGIKPIPPYGATSAVPQLFQFAFPSWFAGFAFVLPERDGFRARRAGVLRQDSLCSGSIRDNARTDDKCSPTSQIAERSIIHTRRERL